MEINSQANKIIRDKTKKNQLKKYKKPLVNSTSLV